MDEVEKLKAVNANLEQRKEELVKELEQVDIDLEHWITRKTEKLYSVELGCKPFD